MEISHRSKNRVHQFNILWHVMRNKIQRLKRKSMLETKNVDMQRMISIYAQTSVKRKKK